MDQSAQGSFCVVGVGELLWDIFPEARRLGGAPANVAYHAAALGDRGLVATAVGTDELGNLALAELASQGVGTSAVQRNPERPTGTARVHIQAGEPRFSIDPQAAWRAPRWTPAWRDSARDADLICFGTLICSSSEGRRSLERMLSDTKAHAIRLLDLNLRPPFDDEATLASAIGLANAIKLSESEIPRLTAKLDHAPATAALNASNLEETGRLICRALDLRCLAMTFGKEGSLLCTKTEAHGQPAVPIETTGGDPVGAGDAFTAALAHHLLRKSPIAHANRAASYYAAFVASQPGAMPKIPDSVRAKAIALASRH